MATQENTLSPQIKIYPNPASKRVFIDGAKGKDISVEIFSADGKTVLESQKVEKDKGIDISGIPAGVYFINLNSENLKYYSQKLIIQ